MRWQYSISLTLANELISVTISNGNRPRYYEPNYYLSRLRMTHSFHFIPSACIAFPENQATSLLRIPYIRSFRPQCYWAPNNFPEFPDDSIAVSCVPCRSTPRTSVASLWLQSRPQVFSCFLPDRVHSMRQLAFTNVLRAASVRTISSAFVKIFISYWRIHTALLYIRTTQLVHLLRLRDSHKLKFIDKDFYGEKVRDEWPIQSMNYRFVSKKEELAS